VDRDRIYRCEGLGSVAEQLAGIHDLESANRFLAQTFLPAFNRWVPVVAARAADGHQAVPQALAEGLSWEAERTGQRDWTVAHGGRWYQVDRRHERLSLAGRKVIVRTLRDGRVQLVYRGMKLRWRALPARPVRQHPEPVPTERAERPPPAAAHPWRRPGGGVGRGFWRGVKAQGRARRAAKRLVGRDSGRPALRSGLPPSRPTNRGNITTNNNSKGDIFS